MGKILLVNPSYRNSYGDSIGSLVNPIFPVLAFANLASVARLNGHVVEIFDMSWLEYQPELFKEKVKSFKPDIIGFSVLSPSMNQVKDLCLIAKKISSNIICVGGGAHVSALPKESLIESHLDAVVIGEGEETFRELINGNNFHSINGLGFRDSSLHIKINEPRIPMKNIDDLPMPAWDLFDLKLYGKYTSRLFAKNTPFVAAEFSRGCIYKCDFCASKLTMAFGYRKKSPGRCAEEVRFMKTLGIREFMLTDDIFTTDVNWAKNVCRELINSDNKIAWSCTNGIRVESSEEELFKLMRKSGCYRVAFGFESGNDEVLKAFGKGGKASLEKGRLAVKEATNADLETIGFFQIGLSSDNHQSIQETVSYAKTLPLNLMKFGVTIPYPGTKMFNDYRKDNLIKSFNWDNYHIYSGFNMFNHKNLTYEEIQACITRAYRETTFLSLPFIFRRFYRGIISGEIFSDAVIFFKYIFLSYTRKKGTTNYAYQDEWNSYDFKN